MPLDLNTTSQCPPSCGSVVGHRANAKYQPITSALSSDAECVHSFNSKEPDNLMFIIATTLRYTSALTNGVQKAQIPGQGAGTIIPHRQGSTPLPGRSPRDEGIRGDGESRALNSREDFAADFA